MNDFDCPWEIAMKCDRGNVRGNNEDSIMYFQLHGMFEDYPMRIRCALVADGMGGGENGELASMSALATFVSQMTNDLFLHNDPNIKPCYQMLDVDTKSRKGRVIAYFKKIIGKAVRDANRCVYNYGGRTGKMGTTFVGVLQWKRFVFFINVGLFLFCFGVICKFIIYVVMMYLKLSFKYRGF